MIAVLTNIDNVLFVSKVAVAGIAAWYSQPGCRAPLFALVLFALLRN